MDMTLLPFWDKLTDNQKDMLRGALTEQRYAKGEFLHQGELDCVGLFLVLKGQLRVYTLSDEGRELTLYRLFDRDMCLLSASCMFSSLQFDVMISAQEETHAIYIPTGIYQKLREESLAVANYTNELMASRFSEVMWQMDKIMNKKLDTRIAALLIEEADLKGEDTLSLTHEQIANHLGSVREVVTRLLRHFQKEGLVKVSRGSIELVDRKALEILAAESMR